VSKRPDDSYYFADGKRIALRADPDHVAVDLQRAQAAALPTTRRAALRHAGQELRKGVILLSRDALDDDERDALERAGALLPAYRAEDATIVVLPEVRVELRDADQVAGLRERLAAAGADPESVTERGHMISFAPASGRAEDALRIANEIYEELSPAASQARFLRVVARPEPRSRGGA
jgi:hypothetical protein